MSQWKKKEGELFHTWELTIYGLRYTLVKDSTYGHYNLGEYKILKEINFSIQDFQNPKKHAEISRNLPEGVDIQHCIAELIKLTKTKNYENFVKYPKVYPVKESPPPADKKRETSPKLFNGLFDEFLKKIEHVLNSEPILYGLHLAKKITEVGPTFEFLLSSGRLNELYKKAIDQEVFIEAEKIDSDTQQFDQFTNHQKTFSKISEKDFLAILKSMLTTESTSFTQFHSFYRQELSDEVAKDLFQKIDFFFSFASRKKWAYYLGDTKAFDVDYGEGGYFGNLGNDSCLVMTDFENHYLVLLTSGTS